LLAMQSNTRVVQRIDNPRFLIQDSDLATAQGSESINNAKEHPSGAEG